MASLREIASAAGVSVRTVRRAFDPAAYVRPQVRQQILAIAQNVEYRPDPIARSLSIQKGCTIAIVVESFYELYINRIEALERTLRQGGYCANFVFEPLTDPDAAPILDDILRFRPAAVVLMPLPHGQRLWVMEELRARQVPCLLMDAMHREPHLDGVYIDRPQGVYEAVDYLVRQGRRHIAYLGREHSVSRLDGYCRALAAHGRAPLVVPAPDATPEEQLAGGREVGLTLREHYPQVDAVQAYSDVMAMGLMAGLHERGLRIPDDVAVVGFDDRSMAACASPPLTTVAQPNAELGEAAGRMLLRRLAGEFPPDVAQIQVLPTRLVRRQSA